VEVNDSGCGMDDETLAKIFDPFFTTKFAGRGLGLAAVLGIIHGHKGALKVYSAPGKGSTFKLFFPVTSANFPLPAAQGSGAELAGQGTVLVVDDEEVVRKAATFTLLRYGYQVLGATSGREAIQIFRNRDHQIALVLLDLTMPGMDGEEVLRELRLIEPSIRVLLSSGFNEVESVRRFTGKGLAGFIQKPYTAHALGAKVKQILGFDNRTAPTAGR
jgi:two-component system cell cycle sensor histidine kinase/response regulator CckA